MTQKRKLWLIDAGYLFNARHSVRSGYEFSYLRLRNYLELDGPNWRAYYLNSTPNPPSDGQDSFHRWMRSGPPFGPKIITKFYTWLGNNSYHIVHAIFDTFMALS